MEVTAVTIKDINDRNLYYIKFKTKGGSTQVINVGEKTFNKIKTLQDEETKQPELPLQGEQTETTTVEKPHNVRGRGQR